MAISHAFTNQVADGTNTSIVRPSDWNSAHNQYYTLSGNTLGASTVSGTNVVFQAAGNVSLSGTGGTIVVYGTNPAVPTSYVSNVNGLSGAISLNAGSSLSASTNGSSITFGLASNITTALQSAGNYLTTQTVQTQASGNIAGSGFTTATTAGTAVVGTLNTAGLNLGIPAYLTTAVAAAVGLNTAQTNVTWTVNSSGISFNAAGYAGTGTSATNATFTLNSAGLAFSAPATSGISNGNNIVISNTGSTIGISAQAVAVGAGSQTATSGTVNFVNSNGVTFGMSGSNQITASVAGGGGMYANLSGATSGNTTASGNTLNFSGVNVTLSGTNNSQIVISAPPVSSLVAGANITISTAGSTISVIGAAAAAGVAAAAGTQTATSGTVNFANSNGISFGMSGSNQITASYTVPTVPTSYVSNVNGSSGQISLNVGSSLSSSTAGSSITFGLASNITTALQSAGAYLTTAAQSSLSNLSIAVAATNNAGGGTATLASSISFSNANGLTFYTSAGNAIVASYTVPTVPTSYVSNVNGSSGQISLNVGSSLSASTNGSSITFGLASNITTALQSANANYLTSQSNQAFSASGGSSTFQTLNFANSNGVTFSNSGGSIVASYTVPAVPTSYVSNVNGSSGQIGLNVGSSLSASTNGSSITFGLASNITTALQSAGAYLTTARASNDAIGLNTAATNVTWTVNSSGLSLNAAGYAGTNTSANNASLTLNSNGLTISVAAPGAANYSIGVSNLGNTAGATGITGTRIVFVGTNNISLSQATDANGATISINQTGGGGGAMYANLSGNTSGNTTASGSTINFSGINITLSGTNNSQIAISAPPVSSLVAGTNITISTSGSTISIIGGAGGGMYANLSGNTSGNTTASGNTLNFSGINLTLSGTNGSQIAISAPATSSLAAGNNISLSSGGSTIGLSALAVALIAGTQTATSGTVNFANSNGISFGMSGSNQITASHNGLTTQSVQTQAAGNIAGTGFTSTTTAGTAITAALGTNGLNMAIPAYLTAAAGGAVNFSAGTTSNNLQTIVFNNANGVSFGLNGSTITASVAPAGGGFTKSGYSPHADYPLVVTQMGQGVLAFDPDHMPGFTMDQVAHAVIHSHATNSTGTVTISHWMGLYTRNASSLSLYASTSNSLAYTFSGTANSSNYSGWRNLTYPWSTSFSEGQYWLAQISRTTTGGANASMSNLVASQIASNFSGIFGQGSNATAQFTLGQGTYSATTSGLPSSVAFSQIQGSALLAQRFPVVQFGYQSV